MPRPKNQEEIEKIVWETFNIIYDVASPTMDFTSLVANSPCLENGKIDIPYQEYSISGELIDFIIQDQTKKFNLTKKDKELLRVRIYLGPRPMFECIKNNSKL